jgi:multicomponent Na+:H+ antiporter subunit E
VTAPGRGERSSPLGRVRSRLPLLVWLVLAWLLLWGRFSVAVLLSGVLAAAAVTWAVRLPPLPGGARLRPWPFLVALGVLLRDLVTSSLTVAWQLLRYGRATRSAVVEVRLQVRSDATLTLVAADLSLRPGSVVVDIDRAGPTLYVHGLPARTDADLDRIRSLVRDAERRVVRAFGTAQEVRSLREGEP